MDGPVIANQGRSNSLAGKVAVVTGAGRGIGREEAIYLSSLGARVVVNDLGSAPDGSGADHSVAELLVDEIRARGGQAVAHHGDISEPTGAQSLLQVGVDEWGQVDIVVNNAGNIRDRMVFTMSVDEWDSVIKAHLRGHFLVTREACVHWRSRARVGGRTWGRLINTTSTSGLFGNVGQSNYGAAKAAIASLTLSTSLEMARYGVTVNAIAPGARTRMTQGVFGPDAPAGDREDPIGPRHVARLVGYLASDAADHITGQVLRVKGGSVELYQGWRSVASVVNPDGWTAEGLETAIAELFQGRPSVYSPPMVPGQDELQDPPKES